MSSILFGHNLVFVVIGLSKNLRSESYSSSLEELSHQLSAFIAATSGWNQYSRKRTLIVRYEKEHLPLTILIEFCN